MNQLLVAHRGAMAEAPENSKTAFDLALSYPINGIEFDVQITGDGIPVIFHDKTLKKINKTSKTISDYTFQELNQFDWGVWFSEKYYGEKILTLEQVLSAYGHKTCLFVEIKSAPNKNKVSLYDELPVIVINLIRKIVPDHFIDNICVLSFDRKILKLAYDCDPSLNFVLNLNTPATPQKLNIEMDALFGCCISHQKLTRKFVSHHHRLNKKVMTYSCNNRKIINRVVSLGADVIMTDDPGKVYKHFFAAVQKES